MTFVSQTVYKRQGTASKQVGLIGSMAYLLHNVDLYMNYEQLEVRGRARREAARRRKSECKVNLLS